jgi:type II secretory pathway component PulK
MDGVSRDFYVRIRPYLCTLDRPEQPAINLNMVREEHAPLLRALLGSDIEASIDDIRAAIAAIPPGGVRDTASLPPPLSAVPGGAVKSALIEARVRLEVNGRTMEETLLFEAEAAADGKGPRLLARAFGDEF